MLAGTALAESGVRHANGAPLQDKLTPQSSVEPSPETKDMGTDQNQAKETEDAQSKAKTMRENADFERAEQAIRQAMQEMPEIAELSKQVLMEITPEGLRIQIIDQEGRSMFPPGASQPYERTQRLIAAITGVILKMPNRLSIAGHTDLTKPSRAGETNWDLSAARANAARRILQANGLPGDRIANVAGKADAEPLFPDDPTLPGNRRISITLLREAPVLPPGHRL
jgi:chemotaxis protein MotB